MSSERKKFDTVCPWVTPKVFASFEDPAPTVKAFFDHYAGLFENFDKIVLNFCTGNGDHILNYRGRTSLHENFDWARYNAYGTNDAAARLAHNHEWLRRCVEGGETSDNPFLSGPAFILSEEKLDYHKLEGIYSAWKEEAKRRGLNFQLLEYFEPGPEFCESIWKTKLHTEGANGQIFAGSEGVGLLDVTSSLHADSEAYAAYPGGIPNGTNTGEFCARQAAAFVKDFGLDGVMLGNQFALCGFWHPDNAPEPTPERRAGIAAFFREIRRAMDSRLVYWMDSYWPAEVEIEKWAMNEENYAMLDAVMISNFAVIAERTQMVPNLESRLKIAALNGGLPHTLFSFDFVDPWYVYRVYLHDKKNFDFQHGLFRAHGHRTQGVSFFANDTYGQYVFPEPLAQTTEVIREARKKIP